MQLYIVVLYGVNYRRYGGWITYDSYSNPASVGVQHLSTCAAC